MVLETYYFASMAMAGVFALVGFTNQNFHARWLIVAAGAIFLLLGVIGQTEGVDREINWRPYRNALDQNRISDLNTTTVTLVGINTTDASPAGVDYDRGFWMMSELFIWVFGYGMILLGSASLILTSWREFQEARQRGLIAGEN